MARIGIIANPQSGTDIRRLVSEADTADSRQKVNVVRRVLKGIAAIGVDEVFFMPDRLAMGARACDGLDLPFRASLLDMPVRSDPEDSLEAARRMRDSGVGVLVVLGGDGTHRVVAKACGTIPLVGISTGTNNVWPEQVEGTLAGMAAALVARGLVAADEVAHATRRLEIERDGSLDEIALVDVAVYDGAFRAARAVWEVERIKEIVLADVASARLGLSAIGAALPRPEGVDGAGLQVRIGPGGGSVLAPLAPGLVCRVPIRDYQWIRVGQTIAVEQPPCLLALDGERETRVDPADKVVIRLVSNGPRRVDVRRTLEIAAQDGRFTSIAAEEGVRLAKRSL